LTACHPNVLEEIDEEKHSGEHSEQMYATAVEPEEHDHVI